MQALLQAHLRAVADAVPRGEFEGLSLRQLRGLLRQRLGAPRPVRAARHGTARHGTARHGTACAAHAQARAQAQA